MVHSKNATSSGLLLSLLKRSFLYLLTVAVQCPLLVECKRTQTDVPQNAILGHLRAIQYDDLQVCEDAAENTANILSESWMYWANGQAALSPTLPHPTATHTYLQDVRAKEN